MKRRTDKERLVEQERTRAVGCVAVLAAVCSMMSVGFIASSVYLYQLNISIADQDSALNDQIDALLNKLGETTPETPWKSEPDSVTDDDVIFGTDPEVVTQLHQMMTEMMEAGLAVGQEHVTRKRTLVFDLIFAAQEAVFEKYCHPPNDTCPIYFGPQGDNGTFGNPGMQGLLGQPGAKGDKGSIGSNGEPGYKGEQGDTGFKGPHGDNGPRGPSGDKGDFGDTGPPGYGGTDGVKGIPGDPGLKGDRGDNGTAGPAGDPLKAINGSKGDPGVNGTKGDPGDAGLPGLKGKDFRALAADCECYKKPSFLSPFTSDVVHVALGGSGDITCQATGNPSPSVTIAKTQTGRRSIAPSSSQNGLYVVNNANSADYGNYVCTASNDYGTATKYVTVAS